MATNSNHPSSSAVILADEVKSDKAIFGPGEVKENDGIKEAQSSEAEVSEIQGNCDGKYPNLSSSESSGEKATLLRSDITKMSHDEQDEYFADGLQMGSGSKRALTQMEMDALLTESEAQLAAEVNEKRKKDMADEASKGAISSSGVNASSSKGEIVSEQKKGGRQGASGKDANNLAASTQGLKVAGADGMDMESQGDKSAGDMKDVAMSVGTDMVEESSGEASKSPTMSKGMSSLQVQAEEGSKKARTRSQNGRGNGAKAPSPVRWVPASRVPWA